MSDMNRYQFMVAKAKPLPTIGVTPPAPAKPFLKRKIIGEDRRKDTLKKCYWSIIICYLIIFGLAVFFGYLIYKNKVLTTGVLLQLIISGIIYIFIILGLFLSISKRWNDETLSSADPLNQSAGFIRAFLLFISFTSVAVVVLSYPDASEFPTYLLIVINIPFIYYGFDITKFLPTRFQLDKKELDLFYDEKTKKIKVLPSYYVIDSIPNAKTAYAKIKKKLNSSFTCFETELKKIDEIIELYSEYLTTKTQEIKKEIDEKINSLKEALHTHIESPIDKLTRTVENFPSTTELKSWDKINYLFLAILIGIIYFLFPEGSSDVNIILSVMIIGFGVIFGKNIDKWYFQDVKETLKSPIVEINEYLSIFETETKKIIGDIEVIIITSTQMAKDVIDKIDEIKNKVKYWINDKFKCFEEDSFLSYFAPDVGATFSLIFMFLISVTLILLNAWNPVIGEIGELEWLRLGFIWQSFIMSYYFSSKK